MRINDSITTPTMTNEQRTVLPASSPTVPVLRDVLHISEAAQQKIDQLQQGNQALEQALNQSRQYYKKAAMERVKYIKDYLKILVNVSPAGDRGAASEAARMVREIKSMAREFKVDNGSEEKSDVRKQIADFAVVAGDALNIAKMLIESYKRKRAAQRMGYLP